jgi:HSP20 family molecular chaperone IbpA
VQITAEARDGVLTIHVPRTAAAQPRKIAVTSA